MAFKFTSRFTGRDRSKLTRELYKFHKANEQIENENKARREIGLKPIRPKSAGTFIKEMQDKGLSYSTGNMYYDIRRAGATFNAKTPDKRARASKWFDEYFEPLRKQKKINAKRAYKLWERAKKQSYENMTQSELEFALELREMGSP